MTAKAIVSTKEALFNAKIAELISFVRPQHETGLFQHGIEDHTKLYHPNEKAILALHLGLLSVIRQDIAGGNRGNEEMISPDQAFYMGLTGGLFIALIIVLTILAALK